LAGIVSEKRLVEIVTDDIGEIQDRIVEGFVGIEGGHGGRVKEDSA